jgi:nucleoside-diphosphate-sugar epimerase
MPKKRVLLTGAGGLIGTILRQRLTEQYDIRSLTLLPEAFPSVVADVSDLDAIAPAFAGMDAVVHLAALTAMRTTWDEALQNNVVGTRNVFEAAVRAGVPAVVVASSNHATGMVEAEGMPGIYDLDDHRQVDPTTPVRPDSYYGLSKVLGEAIGRYYADIHGIRTIMLRLGWVMRNDNPADPPLSSDHRLTIASPPLTLDEIHVRARAIYLSHRDCAELFRCALEADQIGYGIYYGISNNPRQVYDISSTRRDLGYAPLDAAPLAPSSAAS